MKQFFILFLIISLNCFSQKQKDYELIARKDSLGTFMLAKNNLPCSTTFNLILKSKDSILKKIILKSLDSIIIFRKSMPSIEELLNFYNDTYTASYTFGDSISSKPDLKYIYKFPFSKNKSYKLLQGWGGSFSHNHPESFHALDFKMDVGQPIHAARGGVVVRTIDHFTENGGRELIDKANLIIIMHEDGTFANYVHLKPQGSKVTVGQKIKSGELIGYSGNTGFSSQPHLHLVVKNGFNKSIPIYFKNHKNRKLKVGKKYTSK